MKLVVRLLTEGLQVRVQGSSSSYAKNVESAHPKPALISTQNEFHHWIALCDTYNYGDDGDRAISHTSIDLVAFDSTQ
jgi:hypothetical protein